jgi:hypothetical protein
MISGNTLIFKEIGKKRLKIIKTYRYLSKTKVFDETNTQEGTECREGMR